MYTRSEWLTAFRDSIKGLPKEEQQKAFAYYNEMFEDKFEQGMTERDIILSFGDPKDAAKAIVDEYKETHPDFVEAKEDPSDMYLPKNANQTDTASIAILVGIVLWPICVLVCFIGLLISFLSIAGGVTCLIESIHLGVTTTMNVTSLVGLGLFAGGFGVIILYPILFGCKKMFSALKKLLRNIKEGK